MKCFAKICNPYKYTCVKHLFVYLVRILSGMSYSCTADTVFHFFDLFHQIVSCEPKYRKIYCSHPGVGVSVNAGVGVALMLKFLVKDLKSISLEHVDELC